jgi:hypothetical protein
MHASPWNASHSPSAASAKRKIPKSSRLPRQYLLQAIRLRKIEVKAKELEEKHKQEQIAAEVGISASQTAEDRAIALNKNVEKTELTIEELEERLKAKQQEKHRLFVQLKEILQVENKLKAAKALEEKEREKVDEQIIEDLHEGRNELEETSPIPLRFPPPSDMGRMDLDSGRFYQESNSGRAQMYFPNRNQMLNPKRPRMSYSYGGN